MSVVDTSVWIEWLIDSPLGKKLSEEMPDKDLLVVPTIVQLELSKWIARERGEEVQTRVIPLLLDLEKRRQLALPLGLYHAAAPTQNEMRRLMAQINSAQGARR